jgi:hypothetical protein
MNKTLDDFAKGLAGGMSRRSAFLKVLGGAGVLGFLGLRQAKAGAVPLPHKFPLNPAQCGSFCLNYADEVYLECVLGSGKENACFQLQNLTYFECTLKCTSRT